MGRDGDQTDNGPMTEETEVLKTLVRCIPKRGYVFIDIYDRGDREHKVGDATLWLPGDDKVVQGWHDAKESKHPGIRNRWARVVGVSQKALQSGIQVGSRILAEQLKWGPSGGVNYAYIDGKHRCFWWLAIEDVLLIDDSDAGEFVEQFRQQHENAEYVIGR